MPICNDSAVQSSSWSLVALDLSQAQVPSQSSGLTQPQATICAAVIALVAALIALGGVLVNARVSERQHREKDAATLRDRNRKDAVDAMVEALAASMRLWDLVGTIHSLAVGLDDVSEDDRPTLSQLNAAWMAMMSAELKLELLDIASFKEVSALREALGTIRDTAHMGSDIEDFASSWDAREAMVKSFQFALKQIDSRHSHG